MTPSYDAILVLSFGGPEKREDVIPFLENVLRGKNVPRERMLAVAEHYYHFGGVSPINAQTRDLITALQVELDRAGIRLPIFWGNRNWHPLLADTLREMRAAGVKRALAYVTSAYASFSSCRQYLGDIERARAEVGDDAPQVDKLRLFFNHPGFIEANAEQLRVALREFAEPRRSGVEVAFTAHSIPVAMAITCDYAAQLEETCRLTAEACGISSDRWRLVYQSRSGRPEDPWLEPDVLDHLRARHAAGVREIVLMPIGFLSDHIEVLYDLDTEARQVCDELKMKMVRAGTVGSHPRFVRMIRELIEERLAGHTERATAGKRGPAPDVCAVGCCPAPMRVGR